MGLEEREDGSLRIWHGERELSATAFPKDYGVAQGEIVENKRLSAALGFIHAQQRERLEAKLARPSATRRDARLRRADAAATRGTNLGRGAAVTRRFDPSLPSGPMGPDGKLGGPEWKADISTLEKTGHLYFGATEAERSL